MKTSEHKSLMEALKLGYRACRAYFEAKSGIRKRDAKNFFWALFNYKKANGEYGVPEGYEGANIQAEMDNLVAVVNQAPATFGERIGYVKQVLPDMAAKFGKEVSTMTDEDRRMKELINKFWESRKAGTLTADSDMVELYDNLHDKPELRSFAGKYAMFMEDTLERLVFNGMTRDQFIDRERQKMRERQ